MPRCFVIQPFDGGIFDKRFKDIFCPAIERAGFEAYRIDQDPEVSIPINDIKDGIRSSALCLADISVDNPNVWFELGFAIAARKDVVLVCAESSRLRFPFDVQHRSVIIYKTESVSDFDALSERVTKRIEAIRNKNESLGAFDASSPISDVEGLSQHEIVALVAVAQNSDRQGETVLPNTIRQDMENAGYTKIAATLAVARLVSAGLLEQKEEYGEQYGMPYTAYSMTESGLAWLMQNQGLLKLTRDTKSRKGGDDLPF